MSQDYFHRVAANTPTEFWVNNVTRNEARLALEAGAVGCTQNPSFVWKILNNDEDGVYAKELLDEILKKESDDDKAMAWLQRELIGNICKSFMPLYEKSGGKYGWVSIQADPFKEDIKSILSYARFNREVYPNMIIKIPATKEGLESMRVLIQERIPILATEVMSIDQAIDVCELYEAVIDGMTNPPVFIFAHIAGIFDEQLQKTLAKENIDVNKDALWQAGIAVAKKIHQMIIERKYKVGFMDGGARGLHHFTEMVGASGAVTINWKGTADLLIASNPPVVQRFLAPVPFSVIDELSDKLVEFRRAYYPKSLTQEEYEHFGPVVLFRTMFEDGWKKSMEYISERRKQLFKLTN